MNSYFFVLGRSYHLCREEVSVLMGRLGAHERYGSQDIIQYDSESELDVPSFMATAGGVVKCGVLFDKGVGGIRGEEIVAKLCDYIEKNFQQSDKASFGISLYGDSGLSSTDLVKSVKERSKAKGYSLQYILPERNELSSVQVQKYGLIQKGIEFVLNFTPEGVHFGRTLAVQPFEEWSKTDYGRPGRDAHSGMLPPKVARMMLTIGLGHYTFSPDYTPLVYDPFCGSGTVLTEALRLGLRVVGSDLSPKAVEDTRNNIDWVSKNTKGIVSSFYGYPPASPADAVYNVFQSDVAHIKNELDPGIVDIIVTEPYLGPPFEEAPTPGKIERIIKGLEKMYIGGFKSMNIIQRSGGILVFAEPEYSLNGKMLNVGIIDKCDRFGYTLLTKPIVYRREKAFVGRRIGVMQKK